uniref:Leucine rich repeat containing 34 n=1 Tax=Crocodylus porosus TaxID=8502 RepID=A0A7M4EVW6_CROPO
IKGKCGSMESVSFWVTAESSAPQRFRVIQRLWSAVYSHSAKVEVGNLIHLGACKNLMQNVSGVCARKCHVLFLLQVFKLTRSKVDDDKARLLIRNLLDHPCLVELDFSHNLIGDRGARAIGKLMNHSRLEILTLCNNQIRPPGAQAIAHALAKNSALISLNLRLNCIEDEGGQAVGHALLSNSSLRSINLAGNELSEPTATLFSLVLAQNTALTSINLSCNHIGLVSSFRTCKRNNFCLLQSQQLVPSWSCISCFGHEEMLPGWCFPPENSGHLPTGVMVTAHNLGSGFQIRKEGAMGMVVPYESLAETPVPLQLFSLSSAQAGRSHSSQPRPASQIQTRFKKLTELLSSHNSQHCHWSLSKTFQVLWARIFKSGTHHLAGASRGPDFPN